MNEQLKGRSFVEEDELLSMLSELMSEIPPDEILHVFPDWDPGAPALSLNEKRIR
jgi:hypothetical protein